MEGFSFIKVCPEDLLGFTVEDSFNTNDIRLKNVEKFSATGDYKLLRVFVRDETGKWVRGKVEKVSRTGIKYWVYTQRPLGLLSTWWEKEGVIQISSQGEVSEVMKLTIITREPNKNRHLTILHYGMRTESELYEKALEALGQIKNGGKSPVWIEK